MATTLTYPVSPFLAFTKIVSADMNSQLAAIQSRLNWAGATDATTGLGDDNIQSNTASGGGLTRSSKLKAGTASYVLINDGTGKMSEAAQVTVAQGGTGQDFSGSLAGSVGTAIVVNNAGSAFTLGSPIQSTLTEALATPVAGTTAGEAITANNAVAVDMSLDGSSNNIYRIFNADYTKVNRRNSFLGFASASATVTAGIYTWVASANFVASNSIAFSINGRAYVVAFTTDNATTLQAVATAMATDPDVNGAVSNASHTVTVTGKGGLFINITGSVVTGGASQPTIAVTNTQAPSGQSVNIQCFGPMSGFTSLTTGAIYYLNTAGGITTAPADPAPVQVGQALSSTVLFVNRNALSFQFTSPNVVVRSHGSSTGAKTGPTQDSEHFNFVSWIAGTSAASGSVSGNSGGESQYTGLHFVIDGENSSGVPTALTLTYNKSSWASVTARDGVNPRGYGGLVAAFGYLYTNNGTTSSDQGSAGGSNKSEKWNNSSWTSNTTWGTAKLRCSSALVNSLVTTAGGLTSAGAATVDHQGRNSSDTVSTLTNFPGAFDTAATSSTPSSYALYVSVAAGSNVTASYTWNGSSFSASLTAAYTQYSVYGSACYATTRALNFTNGGQTADTASVVNTSQTYNGTSFASSTASSNSRGRRAQMSFI